MMQASDEDVGCGDRAEQGPGAGPAPAPDSFVIS